MKKSLNVLWWAAGLLFSSFTVRAEQPAPPPQNRAWVIHTYGEPTGAAKAGEREILTYPQGRVVLKNGIVFSSTMDGASQDASAPSVPQAPATPAETPKPPAVSGWLGSMEIAKARARAEQKRVLLLYWGGDSSCPWAPVFDRTIVGNRSLLARLEEDYVLVKIMYPPKISEQPSEAEFDAMVKADKFRLAVVETQALPAMAIVTADGLSATKVEIENAMSAKNDMERFVLKALTSANKQKPKKIKL